MTLHQHVNDKNDPHETLKKAKQARYVGSYPEDLSVFNDGDLVAVLSTGQMYFVSVNVDAEEGEPSASLVPFVPTGASDPLKADLVGGKVPAAQLPSYVDDVLEYSSISGFPETGESGKIYVAVDTDRSYRWTGTQYTEVSPSPTPVAPSTSASDAGKPADAKATGDALDVRPTKAQLDAGWWSEWTILRDDVDVTSRVRQPVWEPDEDKYADEIWDVDALPSDGEHGAGMIDSGVGRDATALHWGSESGAHYTATRHRVAAPVPTKPEDIGAQPAGNYLTQHQQLTPVYGGNGERFSEWEIVHAVEPERMRIVWYDEEGIHGWVPQLKNDDEWVIVGNGKGDSNSTDLTWIDGVDAETDVTATRTENPIIGYTLGDQTTKPLQPQGDYAPAANIAKSALASDVQTSLGKADTALQTAPVTSVNSKTGAVVLNASDIGAATAAQGAKADTAVQPAALAGYATTAQLRYDIGTETAISSASSEVVEGQTVTYGSATLADRTANRVAVTVAIAELRLTFPIAVSGKVRDFGLRVEVGTGSAALTAPALVPPAGVALENADGDIPALADGTATAKGVTLLYFSETAPGKFLIKGEQVKEA